MFTGLYSVLPVSPSTSCSHEVDEAKKKNRAASQEGIHVPAMDTTVVMLAGAFIPVWLDARVFEYLACQAHVLCIRLAYL